MSGSFREYGIMFTIQVDNVQYFFQLLLTAFADFRMESGRISVQTRSNRSRSVFLVLQVVVTVTAVASIAEFTVGKTVAISGENMWTESKKLKETESKYRRIRSRFCTCNANISPKRFRRFFVNNSNENIQGKSSKTSSFRKFIFQIHPQSSNFEQWAARNFLREGARETMTITTQRRGLPSPSTRFQDMLNLQFQALWFRTVTWFPRPRSGGFRHTRSEQKTITVD